jgi:hypothetical protein
MCVHISIVKDYYVIIIIIIIVVVVFYLSWSCASFCPLLTSHIQRSLHWSPLVPSVFWSVVSYYLQC